MKVETFIKVVLVGTDPENIRGGIGTAMQGYIRTLERIGCLYRIIPSYSPVARFGRWLLAVKAIPVVIYSGWAIRRNKHVPCHFAHAGSWPSIIREGGLALLSRSLRVRVLFQLHSLQVDTYLDSRIGEFLFKLGILPAHALGVLTPWWKKRLMEAGIKKPMFVIPNPLSSTLEKVALAPGNSGRNGNEKENTDAITVLAMARLVDGKGVDTVINALPLLPDKILLLIAGDGPKKKALEELVVKKGVAERVTFTGWVDEREKGKLLSSVDIFCLPSHNDSFGMCYLEAMAYGVPVIALNWGPIADVVPDGKAGLLVEETTPEKVADAIRRLLDCDLRKAFSTYGKKWVIQEYSSSAVERKLRVALPQVCKGKNNKISLKLF